MARQPEEGFIARGMLRAVIVNMIAHNDLPLLHVLNAGLRTVDRYIGTPAPVAAPACPCDHGWALHGPDGCAGVCNMDAAWSATGRLWGPCKCKSKPPASDGLAEAMEELRSAIAYLDVTPERTEVDPDERLTVYTAQRLSDGDQIIAAARAVLAAYDARQPTIAPVKRDEQGRIIEACLLCGCEWVCPDCNGKGHKPTPTPASVCSVPSDLVAAFNAYCKTDWGGPEEKTALYVLADTVAALINATTPPPASATATTNPKDSGPPGVTLRDSMVEDSCDTPTGILHGSEQRRDDRSDESSPSDTTSTARQSKSSSAATSNRDGRTSSETPTPSGDDADAASESTPDPAPHQAVEIRPESWGLWVCDALGIPRTATPRSAADAIARLRGFLPQSPEWHLERQRTYRLADLRSKVRALNESQARRGIQVQQLRAVIAALITDPSREDIPDRVREAFKTEHGRPPLSESIRDALYYSNKARADLAEAARDAAELAIEGRRGERDQAIELLRMSYTHLDKPYRTAAIELIARVGRAADPSTKETT